MPGSHRCEIACCLVRADGGSQIFFGEGLMEIVARRALWVTAEGNQLV